MTSSTSFRISTTAKSALAQRAAREHTSATALLEQLIVEGIRQLDHPGIGFRGSGGARRAGLAAGPDVWGIVSRLQELAGSEEDRIAVLSAETMLHPRLIRVALDYAAAHPDDVQARIDDNRTATDEARQMTRNRQALLGLP